MLKKGEHSMNIYITQHMSDCLSEALNLPRFVHDTFSYEYENNNNVPGPMTGHKQSKEQIQKRKFNSLSVNTWKDHLRSEQYEAAAFHFASFFPQVATSLRYLLVILLCFSGGLV